MTLLQNSFEGGTENATITTGYVAGGDAFNEVSVAGGGAALLYGALAHTDGASIDGSQGAKLTNSTAAATYLGWNTFADANWEIHARGYFLMDSLSPNTGVAIMSCINSVASSQIQVQLDNTGKFRLKDGTTTTVSSTKKMRLGEWTRLELDHSAGGAITLKIYIGFPSAYNTTPDDTITFSAPSLTGTFKTIRFQIAASAGGARTVYWDRVAISDVSQQGTAFTRDIKIPGTAAGTTTPPANPTRCWFGTYCDSGVNPSPDNDHQGARITTRETLIGRDYDIGHGFFDAGGASAATWLTRINSLNNGGAGKNRIPYVSTFGFAGTEPNFSFLTDVTAGSRDTDIDHLADGIKQFGNPVFLRMMWEMQNYKGNLYYNRSPDDGAQTGNFNLHTGNDTMTLNGARSVSDTSIVLNSGQAAHLPVVYPFYITIDGTSASVGETLQVTNNNRGTDTLTVAAPGCAFAHVSGATVRGPYHLRGDYEATWRYIVRRLHRKGCYYALTVWCTSTQCETYWGKTVPPFDTTMFPNGHDDWHSDTYYPGYDWNTTASAWVNSNNVSTNDYVDWVSQDGYNGNGQWGVPKTLKDIFDGTAAATAEPTSVSPGHSTYKDFAVLASFSTAGVKKPCMIGETGAKEPGVWANPGSYTKGQWMRDARDAIKPVAQGGTGTLGVMLGVVYFDTAGWYIDSTTIPTSTASLTGFEDWANDSYFGGVGGGGGGGTGSGFDSDTFDRAAVGSGWGTSTGGGVWTASGSAGVSSTTGTKGQLSLTPGQNALMYFANSDAADVDLVMLITLTAQPAGTSPSATYYLTARMADTSNYYRASFQHNGSNGHGVLGIARVVGGTSTSIANASSATTLDIGTVTASTDYLLRFNLIGQVLRVKAWAASGPEPAWTDTTKVFTVTDSTFTASGMYGMRAITAAGNTSPNPGVPLFDNYQAAASVAHHTGILPIAVGF